MRDQNSSDHQASADLLGLLGNEARLEILLILHDPSTDTPMSFSELFDHSSTTHSSGFNYHLDKLEPEIIKKKESGYTLTSFGKRVTRAISAGTFVGLHEFNDENVDGDCIACGEEALIASFVDEEFAVNCRACGEHIIRIMVPPQLANKKETEEVINAVDKWLKNWMQMGQSLQQYSICEYCGGTTDCQVIDDVTYYNRLSVLLRSECTACGSIVRSTVGSFASQHPKVKRFHYKRDAALGDRRYWEVDQWMSNENCEILSQDPYKFCVTFHESGDTCEVLVDDKPSVVDVTVTTQTE